MARTRRKAPSGLQPWVPVGEPADGEMAPTVMVSAPMVARTSVTDVFVANPFFTRLTTAGLIRRRPKRPRGTRDGGPLIAAGSRPVTAPYRRGCRISPEHRDRVTPRWDDDAQSGPNRHLTGTGARLRPESASRLHRSEVVRIPGYLCDSLRRKQKRAQGDRRHRLARGWPKRRRRCGSVRQPVAPGLALKRDTASSRAVCMALKAG